MRAPNPRPTAPRPPPPTARPVPRTAVELTDRIHSVTGDAWTAATRMAVARVIAAALPTLNDGNPRETT